VGSWNFVLLGLLAVMLLPLAEGLIAAGQLHLVGPRTLFLVGTLAVIFLNYLPTRLGLPALLLAGACAGELLSLADPESASGRLQQLLGVCHVLLATVPWLAYLIMRVPAAARSEFDRLWLDFRDRFGLLWGQRMREQFNRAAANAGWPVVLRWQGLRLTAPLPEPGLEEAILATLRVLLKRFRSERGALAP
jgi:hypothetical protein